MSTISSVAATDQGLVVEASGTGPATFTWRWVRDHGEDAASFDAATKQRRIYAIGANEPQRALSVEQRKIDDVPVVAVTWPEDPSTTWISEETLSQLLAPAPPVRPTPWHRGTQTNVTAGEVTAVLHDDDALAAWLQDQARYGFGILRGFDGGHAEVSALAQRIGYARSSIFGATWDLASDIAHHDDTAYSQSFLAPHTDGTYCHEAPGLQMFCCIERDGTGGESVVVDGFAIAETLRNESPEDFDILTTVEVPAHYIEPGVELRASRPPIRLDDYGNVVQISMNNYDRSPMLLPPEQMADFYRAYGRLHEIANDQSRWMSVYLHAGDVLINDNWRVLHGRQAYTGSRRFIGCYLNHEDFESRCRTLGVTP